MEKYGNSIFTHEIQGRKIIADLRHFIFAYLELITLILSPHSSADRARRFAWKVPVSEIGSFIILIRI